MNFKTDIFRTYGTQDLMLEIPIRHMNVTAKDNALISKIAYSWRYPLPFAFRRSTELTPKSTDIKAKMKTVRAKAFFKAKPSFRTTASRRQETESAFKKVVT